MLKILREVAVENRLFFQIIMVALALVFIISMGWWGFGGQERKETIIAEVNGVSISLDEYQKAYKNRHDLYRAQLQEQLKDAFREDFIDVLNIKQEVINNLIEKRLWLSTAQDMGLSVSDEELRDAIMRQPPFQQGGHFDSKLYHDILKDNHIAPPAYEQSLREALVIEKTKMAIRDSVAMSDRDLQDARKNMTGKQSPDEERKTLDGVLSRKRERALLAFTEALKEKAAITIKNDLL